MKTVFSIVLFCLLSAGAFAMDPAKTFSEAEKFYKKNQFAEALNLYKELEKQNYIGVELYYNMANCYYKTGELGRAITYLEKARKLDPSDEDVVANLNFVNAKLKYKVNNEEVGLSAWFHRVVSYFASDTWTKYGLFLWTFAFVGFILLRTKLAGRSVAVQASSWLFATLACICLVMGFINYTWISSPSNAVIVEGSVEVRESPSESAKNIGNLHEGAKVRYRQQKNNWIEISTDGQSYGWVKAEEAAVI